MIIFIEILKDRIDVPPATNSIIMLTILVVIITVITIIVITVISIITITIQPSKSQITIKDIKKVSNETIRFTTHILIFK